MQILGIIPVRYQSSRFPGKALVDIQGKSMVQRVYQQALKSRGLAKVIVATDSSKIFRHISEIGGNVCMTREDHPSGTDRCQEAQEQQDQPFDFIVNIQGDEPFIAPEQIEELCEGLGPDVQIATQAKLIEQPDDLNDPNCVKVVRDKTGKAIYFSRSPLPYQKNKPVNQWLNTHRYYQHIGIYAYRTDILKEITGLPLSSLEKAEGLEQLRWLENGFEINVPLTRYRSYGIDTPEDLTKALAANNS